MYRLTAVSLALALAAMSSCVDGDVADPPGTNGCTPGRQESCACGGGIEGFQVCKSDGSSFGACLGCSDADPIDTATIDTGSSEVPSDTTTTPSDTSEDTTVIADTATGPTWVWLDRGGPAFQSHACPDGPGVTGGNLVDPEAFFAALIKGKSAADWLKVMNDIEASLWACGVGQQRDSGGTVRGRLFLPTAGCPDASPPSDDALAIKLGVRQEPACWSHAVDVVDGGS